MPRPNLEEDETILPGGERIPIDDLEDSDGMSDELWRKARPDVSDTRTRGEVRDFLRGTGGYDDALFRTEEDDRRRAEVRRDDDIYDTATRDVMHRARRTTEPSRVRDIVRRAFGR